MSPTKWIGSLPSLKKLRVTNTILLSPTVSEKEEMLNGIDTSTLQGSHSAEMKEILMIEHHSNFKSFPRRLLCFETIGECIFYLQPAFSK